MISVYTERKHADVEVLVGQWHDAFSAYDVGTIDAAWKLCRVESEFFPSIAKFMGFVRASFKPPVGIGRYEPEQPPEPFCQEGRTVEEEIAHRAAVCLRLRQKHGFNVWKPQDDTPAREVVPASQGGPTSALIALAKANGYYRGADQDEQAA